MFGGVHHLIKESLYFNYAGVDSDQFGITNVNVSTGLFEEIFMPNRSINEYKIRGRDKPYFQEINREANSLSLTFYPEGQLTEERLSEIARWLDVDFYEPLVFSAMPDRVFYATCVDASNLRHNGVEGYITLTMRLDAPNSYSRDIVTTWYDLSEKENEVIEIPNYGDKPIVPEIFIEKIGDGDIIIENLSEKSPPFYINGLKDKEEIYVDGESRIIKTNIPNTYRYSNSNKKYPIFSYGLNRFKVTGKCKIKFQYRYKFII